MEEGKYFTCNGYILLVQLTANLIKTSEMYKKSYAPGNCLFWHSYRMVFAFYTLFPLRTMSYLNCTYDTCDIND